MLCRNDFALRHRRNSPGQRFQSRVRRFPVSALSARGFGLRLERGEQTQDRRCRTQLGCLPRAGVLESHRDPVGLDPLKRPFSQGRAGGDLQAVKETGLGRLGERAFASDLNIEVPFGTDRAKPGHAYPCAGDHRRPEVAVKLHNLRKPCRVAGLAFIVGCGATDPWAPPQRKTLLGYITKGAGRSEPSFGPPERITKTQIVIPPIVLVGNGNAIGYWRNYGCRNVPIQGGSVTPRHGNSGLERERFVAAGNLSGPATVGDPDVPDVHTY